MGNAQATTAPIKSLWVLYAHGVIIVIVRIAIIALTETLLVVMHLSMRLMSPPIGIDRRHSLTCINPVLIGSLAYIMKQRCEWCSDYEFKLSLYQICLGLYLVLRVDEIDTESCIGVSHANGPCTYNHG